MECSSCAAAGVVLPPIAVERTAVAIKKGESRLRVLIVRVCIGRSAESSCITTRACWGRSSDLQALAERAALLLLEVAQFDRLVEALEHGAPAEAPLPDVERKAIRWARVLVSPPRELKQQG
jgi:hypothetical protein